MIDPLSALPAAIHAVAPHADAATWTTALAPPMRSSGITTPSRIAAFLGQIAVESADFVDLTEDLYYSPERLCEVWPSHFQTIEAATPCAYDPEVLANRVYAGINGNGDTASGDGWTFRGRGLIQITGRANYTLFAVAMHMSLPDAVAFAGTPAGAAASACWFWSSRALNAWADTWEITAITRRINPALEGAAERIALANVARAVLGAPEGLSPNPATIAASSVKTAPEEITPDTDEADLLDSEFNPAPEQST